MFSLTAVNLGEISVGSSHTIEFPYTDDVNYIQRVTSPCGCTSVTNDVGNRKIIAVYTAQPIPVHLTLQGINLQDKQLVLEIEYLSNTFGDQHQNLIFTAKVRQ
jgi:hypothetical protein